MENCKIVIVVRQLGLEVGFVVDGIKIFDKYKNALVLCLH